MSLGTSLHHTALKILRLALAVLFASGSLGPSIAWAKAGPYLNARPAARPAVTNPLPANNGTPSVSFSAAVYRGYETDGTIPITVTLSTSPAVTATVDYATSAGSAQPGVDYTALSGTFTFSPGVTSQTVNLPLLDNPLGQADRTLTATLSNPVNASLGLAPTALVVIGDSETTVLTVTKSADTNHGACELSDCSLREAVIAANAYPGPNAIFLPARVYTLSLAGANEFAAATGDLNITGDLALSGVTSATSVITTTGLAFGDRVFQIAPSTTMTVSDVTVSGGRLQTGGGGGFYNQGALSILRGIVFSNTAQDGGGISNAGALQLASSTVISNYSSGDGGGVSNHSQFWVASSSFASNQSNGEGGGIASDKPAQVISTTFSQNQAIEGGGLSAITGIGKPGVVVTGSTFDHNLAQNGGGLHSTGNVTVTQSIFTANQGTICGGALEVWPQGDISNSLVISNTAPDGGGICATGVTWLSGTTVLSNTATNNGGGISSAMELIAANDTIAGNSAAGDGGGIYNNLSSFLQLSDSTVASNTAASADPTRGNGGGLANFGAFTATNTSLSGNSATGNGGGLYDNANPASLPIVGPTALNNITVTANVAGQGNGGGIFALGIIQLTASEVVSNSASDQGGGIYSNHNGTISQTQILSNTASNKGGGISANGLFQITNSTLAGNKAENFGSALYVYTGTQALVDSSNFVGNQTADIFAIGAIDNQGYLTVTKSVFYNTIGDAIVNHLGHLTLASSIISNSNSIGLLNEAATAVITGSTITENPAGGAGNGGSLASMIVINSVFSSNANPFVGSGGGAIKSFGSLAITGSTFISNSAAGGGSAIYSNPGNGLRISQSTFTNNTDTAIYNIGTGFPTSAIFITDSVFSNNTNGGAIFNEADLLTVVSTTFSANSGNRAAAIYTPKDIGAVGLIVRSSAFYSNTSTSDAGAIQAANTPTILANSTFSGNRAAENAGAILVVNSTATLNNVTLSGNVAGDDGHGTGHGGGLVITDSAVVTITNSIVAGNVDPSGQAPDCAGTLATGDHNLIQSTAGCTLSGTASGDVIGQPALLGPLQNNSGPTWTRALLPGSPAIDGGSPAAPGTGGAACEPTDQRGILRPQGLACDIGAYEAVGLTATATVQFAGSIFTGTQTAGTIPITVTLSRLMPITVTVQYSTMDGTALAGADYTAASGVVTFTPGLTQTTFNVALLSDGPYEANDSFSVALSAPSVATLGVPNTATVTIVDDEPPPSVALSSRQYTVTASAGAVVITATLSAASALTTTVHYATSDGAALAGVDYLATSGTLTFTPGVTLTTFAVPIISASLHEPDESFAVALSSSSGAVLSAPPTATVTIEDDAPAPLVSFTSSQYTVTESAGPALITATLSAASELTAAVHYTTSDGTAQAGSDYAPVSGTLTFAPGQVQQVFTVPITNDNQLGSGETVQLTLSTPNQATLGSPITASLTILGELEYRQYLPLVIR